ncbi:8-oxo-dGTP diphosphatase [Anaerosolibacter carboniphilus]|uniref:8-oxo-dGTP diphosphatase n=1 Tax=Anaerosolibacter carboniphilus TaxID=1417629 RepID=A0A841KS54_9FIRM|nr:8-oxo-dGTP diphosphatase MutT [Anaerosolibacter carboniphilus]MBB6216257.1 8-oxo-dGTP diphosphatase [Anaerosolibacter carboniphilus]
MQQQPLIVTAALIRKENKILIAQRYVKTDHSLKWEFPGGKLESGETPEECLAREIKEELNLKIEVKDIFKVVYHEYPEKKILLLCYLCNDLGGQAEALDCNDFRWINIDALNQFDFVEADVPIVQKIKRLELEIFEIDR